MLIIESVEKCWWRISQFSLSPCIPWENGSTFVKQSWICDKINYSQSRWAYMYFRDGQISMDCLVKFHIVWMWSSSNCNLMYWVIQFVSSVFHYYLLYMLESSTTSMFKSCSNQKEKNTGNLTVQIYFFFLNCLFVDFFSFFFFFFFNQLEGR